MTVSQLIKALQDLPADNRVVMQINNETFIPMITVISDINEIADMPDRQVTLFGYLQRNDKNNPLVVT